MSEYKTARLREITAILRDIADELEKDFEYPDTAHKVNRVANFTEADADFYEDKQLTVRELMDARGTK